MFEQNFVLKSNARGTLKSNWIKAILVSVSMLAMVIFCEYFCGAVSAVLNTDYYFSFFNPVSITKVTAFADIAVTLLRIVMASFLLAPVMLGTMRFFYALFDNKNISVSEMFYFFSSKKSLFFAVKVYFSFLWRFLLIVLVCFLPYNILSLLTSVDFYNSLGVTAPVWLVTGTTFNQVFFIIGVIFSVLLNLSMFFVPFLSAVCSEMKVNEVFKISRKVAKRYYAYFLSFILSFAGWMFLSIFAFPVIYTLPFFICSFAAFCREILVRLSGEKTENVMNF